MPRSHQTVTWLHVDRALLALAALDAGQSIDEDVDDVCYLQLMALLHQHNVAGEVGVIFSNAHGMSLWHDVA